MKTTAFMLQCSMFAAGVTTIVQSWGVSPVGSEAANYDGYPVLHFGSKYKYWFKLDLGLSALFGAFLIGGILEAVLGSVLIKLF